MKTVHFSCERVHMKTICMTSKKNLKVLETTSISFNGEANLMQVLN